MRIVYVVPGTGGNYYCQNCVRDLALIRALREKGHDVVAVPMYLPLTADDADFEASTEVFFGAVNTYLYQNMPFYRRLPSWIRKRFDSPKMLAWAASKSGSTRATGLEQMTLSMAQGESGNQATALDELIHWLASVQKPDVVHLSDALLIGLARRLKNELGATVVCSLQDEDTWVDSMADPYKDDIWRTIGERARDVDMFVAVSDYYGNMMKNRLNLDRERVSVVPIGLNMAGYNQAPMYFRPPTLGYISRMSESLGLGVLVEALVRLKTNESWLKNMRLRVTGGYTEDDRPFLEGLGERLTAIHMQGDVDFVSAFDTKSRIDFLQTISVFSVPSQKGEAFGLHILESLASGVPVVQPAIGAYAELVESTGGGLLYDPADLDQYVYSLKSLLLDADKAKAMGAKARAYVRSHFSIDRTALQMLKVYESAGKR